MTAGLPPDLPRVTLAKGRDKPLRLQHPWIFSGAVARMDAVTPGALVDVVDDSGRWLARGFANPQSQIRVRVLTFDAAESIGPDFWRRRMATALAGRERLVDGETDCVRLVMSEADRLPGLTVDRFGDWLVVQSTTAGVDRHLEAITDALMETVRPRGILERSDDSVRELEGLPLRSGTLAGEAPPDGQIEVREHGLRIKVDTTAGHKTGFYLDQRRNRRRIGSLARGRRVLDVCSYTGGFSLHAARGGAARVTAVDASAPALARLDENLRLNGFTDKGRYKQVHGDAFEILRDLAGKRPDFDLIVLDPPKFAASAAQVERATRGYKDLNLQAFKMLKPGGLLATYSCSGHISADLFQKVVFGAMLDSGRLAQILEHHTQDEDHPVLLSFPESLYLKGLLCRVTE